VNQNANNTYELTFREVEEQLKSLLYIKGEVVVTHTQKTHVELIIKKTLLMKALVRMRLIDRGSEQNEFEIITSNRYGQTKANFNLDDVNDEFVLFAQHYFPVEYNKDPRLLLSIIIRMTV
jgi:hypothetical protein